MRVKEWIYIMLIIKFQLFIREKDRKLDKARNNNIQWELILSQFCATNIIWIIDFSLE